MDIDYEEFKCPICKLKFDEGDHLPRLLIKCGHTICTTCLQSKLKENNNMITCPEDLVLYENITKVEEMPTNHYLLKLIRKHETIKQDESPLLTPKQSKDYIRKSSTIRTSLKHSPLNNNCLEHSQQLTMICLEHKAKICSQCVLKNEHKDHTVITDEEFMNQIDLLIDLFQEVDLNIMTYNNEESLSSKESLNKIDIKIKRIIERYRIRQTNLIECINRHCNESIKLIEQRQSELNDKYSNCEVQIKELNDSSQEWLTTVQTKLDVLNEISDPLTECVKLINEDQSKNQLALINSGRSLINKYTSIQRVSEMIRELDSYPDCLVEVRDETELKNVFEEVVKKSFAVIEDRNIITKLNLKHLFEVVYSSPMNNGNNHSTNSNGILSKSNTVSSIQMTPTDTFDNNLKRDSSISNQETKTGLTSENSLQGLINTTDIRGSYRMKPHPKSYYSINDTNELNATTTFGISNNNSSNASSNKIGIQGPPRPKTPNKDKIVFIKTQLKNEIANFSRIDIGDDGIKLICSFLDTKPAPKVKELKLVKSNLTDDSVIYLIKAIENSNCLSSINLSNNGLSDKVGDSIISFLSKNPNLKTINLSNNLFSIAMKERLKSYSSSSKAGGSLKVFI